VCGEGAVHPLHSHLLLYSRPIDSRAVLHTLTALSGAVPTLLVLKLLVVGGGGGGGTV
jgi:hypothetical protein